MSNPESKGFNPEENKEQYFENKNGFSYKSEDYYLGFEYEDNSEKNQKLIEELDEEENKHLAGRYKVAKNINIINLNGEEIYVRDVAVFDSEKEQKEAQRLLDKWNLGDMQVNDAAVIVVSGKNSNAEARWVEENLLPRMKNIVRWLKERKEPHDGEMINRRENMIKELKPLVEELGFDTGDLDY